MGAYLSEPVTTKISNDESGENVAFGASSMQGWRVSQEDAHNCCINFDDNVSLFAVYDGHGGHEVATYCASKLPDFIKQTDAYKRGDIRQALIDAFLGFDATLAKPEIIKILKEISGNNVVDKNADGDGAIDSDDEDNVCNLKREAEMPLEQVMAKYQLENPQFKSEKFGKRLGATTSASPYLRCRRTRDKAGSSSSSSDAGCSSGQAISSLSSVTSSSSSSSASWNTNEADVSSSSTPCGSTTVKKPTTGVASPNASATVTAAATADTPNSATTSAADATPDDDNKKSNSPGSSETDLILDSTTSNGEVAHECKAKESIKTSESSKTSDMPDSSVGVTDRVSPSKPVTTEDTPATSVSTNGAESKGAVDADCSRGDNVSSSSTMENGEITQQEGISSSSRRTTAKPGFYCNLWDKTSICGKNEDDEDDEDDDDEDENDASFDAVAQSASDDDPDMDENDSSDDIDDDDDDGLDEDDDDDDDDDEDDDDMEEDDDDSEFTINEEPGSDSGCTAVVSILQGNNLFVANAGDSRCVLCRDGEALELSLDHKPEDEPEMKRIVKAGGKVTADGRVNGGLNLSRALGDHAYKQNAELPAQDQMISALPDVRHIVIDPKRDEFMVLACDGIWNFMSSDDVVKFVRQRIDTHENLSKICEELFHFCLAPDTMGDGTGCDNMTAVIVKFKSIPEISKNNVADGENVATPKKRPISPNGSTGNNDDTSTLNNSIDGCKRAKI